MESYWPKASEVQATSADNREIAHLMNNTEKIVFSRTLGSVSETKNWRNVKLVREFDAVEIQHLKERPGKDISVGGSNLALSFMKAGLIDELKFMIFPVVIGKGSTILQGIEGRFNLKLTKTRRFNSGNLLAYYKPAKAPNVYRSVRSLGEPQSTQAVHVNLDHGFETGNRS